MAYLVFISHATKDRWIPRQISNLIEQKGKGGGTKTFLDEKDIEGGQSIPEIIRQNLFECDEFLILLSSYSIDHQWIIAELGAAWVLEKRIIALLDKIAPDQIPSIINTYKAFDINDFDEYLQQ